MGITFDPICTRPGPITTRYVVPFPVVPMTVLAHERRWLAAANKIATTFAASFYLQPDAAALHQLVGRNCEYAVNSLARLNVHGSFFLGYRRAWPDVPLTATGSMSEIDLSAAY